MVYDEARREYMRQHYQKNKANYRKNNEIKKERLKAKLRELKDLPCMDCGECYPHYVMDFDHRPGTQKLCKPSDLVTLGSWRVFYEEIAKCDLVCANCHRERTFQRLFEEPSF